MQTDGRGCAGLEFEFSYANAVFYKKNMLSTTVEDVEGTVYIPVMVGLAERLVVQEFYSDVPKRLVGEIAGDVSEGRGRKAGLAVPELDSYFRLVFDGVDHLGPSQRHINVIVAVPVHEGFGMRGNLDAENTNQFVFQDQVMVRFSGYLDFGGGLRGEEREVEAKNKEAMHAGDCSTRIRREPRCCELAVSGGSG